MKDALFFAGENGSSYVGLSVYLDSPMIFALLGLDTIAREESYKLLVEEMINAGCKVLIFDHNLEEVLGILNGAAGWALGDKYDMSKANNAAKYFHDSGMNRQEIYEFIDDVEAKLNIRGISVSIGEYNKIENEFQAAEEEIYEMIESRYKSNNAGFDSAEHEHKIRVDVRSIVMVYRKRAGNVSSTIQSSHHVMITTNGTIANICREYQNTLRLESAHIPACISTDLFGTILWLQRPAKLIDYQKKRLLADCYCALQPNKKMIDLLLKSLEKAYKDEKIDESKFYFLRAHPIVRESLMNVTKGDYALFNDRTWIEVYDEIQKKADNKFKTEVFVHEQTRRELEIERKKNHALNEKIEKDRQIRKEKFNNNAIKLGWFFTAIFCGLPYMLLLSIFEIAKSAYNQINFNSVVNVIGLLLVTGILAILFRKGKRFCFQCASKVLTKYSKTEEIFLD